MELNKSNTLRYLDPTNKEFYYKVCRRVKIKSKVKANGLRNKNKYKTCR